MKPKFNIGDEVKFSKDPDSQSGKVLSFSYVPEVEEFRYVFSAKAFDPEKNEMIEGVKTCLESEITLIKAVETKKDVK
jgi:hypothetical protein